MNLNDFGTFFLKKNFFVARILQKKHVSFGRETILFISSDSHFIYTTF